jgi:hypothetical protein
MNYIKKLWYAHVAAISAMMMAEYSAAMVGAPAGRVKDLVTAYDKWAERFKHATDYTKSHDLAKHLGYDDGFEDGWKTATEYAVAYIRSDASKLRDMRGYRAADISAGMLSVANDLEEGCHEPRKMAQ